MLGDPRPVEQAPGPAVSPKAAAVPYAPSAELLQRYQVVGHAHPGANAGAHPAAGYAPPQAYPPAGPPAGYPHPQAAFPQPGYGPALPAPKSSGAGAGVAIAIAAVLGVLALVGIAGAVLIFTPTKPPPPPPVVASPKAANAPRTTPAAVLDSYAHGKPLYDGEKVRVCGTVTEVTRAKITLRTTGGPGAATLDLAGPPNGALDDDAVCATCTGRGVGPGIALFDGCTDVAVGTR